MNDRAIYANANALLLPLADKSVHMIATSPPYWGLRSYDTGDNKHAELGAEKIHDCLAWARGDEPCGQCYVCNMRTWAREMHRVLRNDGVMFLNLGDSYYGGKGQSSQAWSTEHQDRETLQKSYHQLGGIGYTRPQDGKLPGLKPKDLCMIPARVALALQADGWYLRSDIIWAKPNPMPESVTDRATKAHEYVFLLTKSARYFWDAEAVKEDSSEDSGFAKQRANGINTWKYNDTPERIQQTGQRIEASTFGTVGRRNLRTVWTIATAPYSGAHFATWPPALAERMIRAGSKVGDIVLDPFAGSGTTLMVARQLSRIGLGFDLSETYLRENCAVRLGHDKLAAWGNGIKDAADYGDLFRNGKVAQ